MPSIRVDQVVAGSTVDIVAEFTDEDNNLTEIDGVGEVTIIGPDGVKRENKVDMTKEETGKWVYFYTVPESGPEGMWKAIGQGDVDTGSNTRVERDRVFFQVVL